MAIVTLGTNTSVKHDSTSVYNYNWSHTLVAGNRRAVFVSVGGETLDSDVNAAWATTSVTYGGQPMTQLVEETTTENGAGLSNNSSELWVIFEADLPSDGANTVQVNGTTDGGAQVYLFGYCAQYGNVAQAFAAATDGTFENQTVTDDTIENNLDPNNADLIVSSYVSGNAGSWTVGQSQVELYDQQNDVGPTNTFGVCELTDSPPGPLVLESTYQTGANRLTRCAASLVAFRKTNKVEAFSKINGVARHDMDVVNGVL